MLLPLTPEHRSDLFTDLVLSTENVAKACGLVINDQFDDAVRQRVADLIQPLWEALKAEHAAQDAARVRTAEAGTHWPAVKR